jgi:hypothetical protein
MGSPKQRGGEEEARSRASSVGEQSAWNGAAMRALMLLSEGKEYEPRAGDKQTRCATLEYHAAASKQLGT